MSAILPKTAAFPWPTLDIDVGLLLTLVGRTVKPGDQYKLGGKAPSLDADSSQIGPIDCSGYLRWLLHRATGNRLVIPDGSWHQKGWAESVGFKETVVASGALQDNRIRLAYMKPLRPGGVGHIALVLNGWTIESSSKRGPGRRLWTGEGWQSRCVLWVLT